MSSLAIQMSSFARMMFTFPLAHIFDHVIEEVVIHHGASIGFWHGDVKLLVENMGELKPTVFCTVPRVLDKIYGGLQDKVLTGGFLNKTLFIVAYKYKQGNMMKGSKHEEAATIFNELDRANLSLVLSWATSSPKGQKKQKKIYNVTIQTPK